MLTMIAVVSGSRTIGMMNVSAKVNLARKVEKVDAQI
jgi:hypothetical protein